MKRRVFLNDVPNVHMYASEGGSNTGNCATACGGSCGGGGDMMATIGVAVVGGVVTNVVTSTIDNPEIAVAAATTVGPGPTIA